MEERQIYYLNGWIRSAAKSELEDQFKSCIFHLIILQNLLISDSKSY